MERPDLGEEAKEEAARAKRQQVSRACQRCADSKRKCSGTFPCDRCVRLAIPHECTEVVLKRQKASRGEDPSNAATDTGSASGGAARKPGRKSGGGGGGSDAASASGGSVKRRVPLPSREVLHSEAGGMVYSLGGSSGGDESSSIAGSSMTQRPSIGAGGGGGTVHYSVGSGAAFAELAGYNPPAAASSSSSLRNVRTSKVRRLNGSGSGGSSGGLDEGDSMGGASSAAYGYPQGAGPSAQRGRQQPPGPVEQEQRAFYYGAVAAHSQQTMGRGAASQGSGAGAPPFTHGTAAGGAGMRHDSRGSSGGDSSGDAVAASATLGRGRQLGHDAEASDPLDGANILLRLSTDESDPMNMRRLSRGGVMHADFSGGGLGGSASPGGGQHMMHQQQRYGILRADEGGGRNISTNVVRNSSNSSTHASSSAFAARAAAVAALNYPLRPSEDTPLDDRATIPDRPPDLGLTSDSDLEALLPYPAWRLQFAAGGSNFPVHLEGNAMGAQLFCVAPEDLPFLLPAARAKGHLLWLHPDEILPRAQVTAHVRSRQLTYFEWEGRYLRVLHSADDPDLGVSAASAAPPARRPARIITQFTATERVFLSYHPSGDVRNCLSVFTIVADSDLRVLAGDLERMLVRAEAATSAAAAASQRAEQVLLSRSRSDAAVAESERGRFLYDAIDGEEEDEEGDDAPFAPPPPGGAAEFVHLVHSDSLDSVPEELDGVPAAGGGALADRGGGRGAGAGAGFTPGGSSSAPGFGASAMGGSAGQMLSGMMWGAEVQNHSLSHTTASRGGREAPASALRGSDVIFFGADLDRGGPHPPPQQHPAQQQLTLFPHSSAGGPPAPPAPPYPSAAWGPDPADLLSSTSGLFMGGGGSSSRIPSMDGSSGMMPLFRGGSRADAPSYTFSSSRALSSEYSLPGQSAHMAATSSGLLMSGRGGGGEMGLGGPPMPPFYAPPQQQQQHRSSVGEPYPPSKSSFDTGSAGGQGAMPLDWITNMAAAAAIAAANSAPVSASSSTHSGRAAVAATDAWLAGAIASSVGAGGAGASSQVQSPYMQMPHGAIAPARGAISSTTSMGTAAPSFRLSIGSMSEPMMTRGTGTSMCEPMGAAAAAAEYSTITARVLRGSDVAGIEAGVDLSQLSLGRHRGFRDDGPAPTH